ncbi:MAG: dTDP-glucose 4,6-dehydratase, partial [Planctomycetota bacterium]|nr:dTDP-glucose 4,6-dehydratase [Planctomycetota bacterium]MDI6788219.1 dTDP-glucose 4,6-dehydratase [Planctomycetota bacterium]
DKDKRYKFVYGDIRDTRLVNRLMSGYPDVVVNFAAESHVDRSLYKPADFLSTNIFGTQVLLESARSHHIKRFIQISTDEVYGSLGPKTPAFTEGHPLDPSSPYSASKSGADLLVKSYEKTFGYKAIITRSSNNYGQYQFPEKLIPLFITNAIANNPLPLYGDGLNIRDWLYVEDNCRAIALVIRKGTPGEIYNIGGNNERTNLYITRIILKLLNKPLSLIKYVRDRPGHDRRYAVNITKIRKQLGWQPQYKFEEGIKKTVLWYLNNEEWWKQVKTGEYRGFYRRHYKEHKCR